MSATTIYVLRLKEGRYYVGKTNRDVKKRVDEHKAGGGNGSAWTRRYPVLGLFRQYPQKESLDEDKYVKKYMINFGIDNVRGGAYSNINLTPSQKKSIDTEIMHASDQCLRCGSSDHFAKECPKDESAADVPKTQRMFCKGLTMQDKPCQCFQFLTREGYCRAHQEQADDEAEEEVSPSVLEDITVDDEERCRGHTHRGLRCRTTRFLSMGGYCWNHEDQEELPNEFIQEEDIDISDYHAGVAQLAGRKRSADAMFGSSSFVVEEACCLGTTQGGSQCQRAMYLNNDGYCRNHEDQVLDMNLPSMYARKASPTTQETCLGMTRSGSQCQCFLYLNHAGYCRNHEDQAGKNQSTKASYSSYLATQQTCRGITQAGSQCRSSLYLNSDGYCRNHEGQVGKKKRWGQGAFNLSPVREATCRGITQAGSRCQRCRNLDGYGYCSQHGNQTGRKRSSIYWSRSYYAQETTCRGTTQSGYRCQRHMYLDSYGYCTQHA